MLIRYLRCSKNIITLTLLIILAVSFVDGQTITISVNGDPVYKFIPIN